MELYGDIDCREEQS